MPTIVQNFPVIWAHKFYFCQNQLEMDFLLLIVKSISSNTLEIVVVFFLKFYHFCMTVNLVVGSYLSLADGNLLTPGIRQEVVVVNHTAVDWSRGIHWHIDWQNGTSVSPRILFVVKHQI